MVILEMVGARKMENLAATGSQTFPGVGVGVCNIDICAGLKCKCTTHKKGNQERKNPLERFCPKSSSPGYLFDQMDEFCSNVAGERNSEATELVKIMVIVALYCVQVHPAQRPPTTTILEMLESQSFKLELPPKVEF